ncbi:tail tubular protein [Nostoc phage Nsp-JY18]
MSSDIFICNLALGHLGKKRINALDEALSEARECAQYYDHVRRIMLQSSNWTFARKRLALAQTTADFETRWPYTYTRPSDALAIRRILPPEADRQYGSKKIPFEVREGKVYTILSPAYAEYTFDLTDVARYSPMFIDAMAYRLASFVAGPLTRSDKLQDRMEKKAEIAQSMAVSADAAQDNPTYFYDDNAVYNEDYSEARY